ncbi:hypothetical protein HDU93_004457 [Gonapodya sp. JEL0774]|nr:hypothetical protein HDU93_004457 [Gonapodya sp. JEL0774]
MGNKNSHFTDEELDVLEECTFFTKREILRIHKWFKRITGKSKDTLTRDEFLALPELAQNPFKERIAEAFITSGDKNATFDDFLDFLSVFSESATRDVKAFYAFRLYDFDEDGYLNEDDISKVVKLVVGDELNSEEIKVVCDNIFEEADIDGDKRLSFVEFEHACGFSQNPGRIILNLHKSAKMAYTIPRNLMNQGVTYNKPTPAPRERKEKPNWDQMRADMGLPPAPVPDVNPSTPTVVHGLAGRTVVVPPSTEKSPAALSQDLLPLDDRSRAAAEQIRGRLQSLMGTSFTSYDVLSYKTMTGGSSNGVTLFIKIRINSPPYGCVHARVYERSGRAMLIAYEAGKTDEEKIEMFDSPAATKKV